MHAEYTMLMSVLLDDEATLAEQQHLKDHLQDAPRAPAFGSDGRPLIGGWMRRHS